MRKKCWNDELWQDQIPRVESINEHEYFAFIDLDNYSKKCTKLGSKCSRFDSDIWVFLLFLCLMVYQPS